MPLLPLPGDRPSTPIQRFLLARAIFLIRQDGNVTYIPRRDLQDDLNRSSGSRVSRHLKTLCEDGWLHVAWPSEAFSAHHYELGGRLKSNRRLQREWDDLAAALFGREGILADFVDRPCFAHGSLNVNGTMIVAVLDRLGAPTDLKTLRDELSFWMTPRTIKTQLARLTKWGLVVEQGRAWALTADWKDALTVLELLGPTDRKASVREQIRSDRLHYRLAHGWTPENEHLKKEFSGWPCCRCSRPSDTIDHFPPKVWGGHDDWFLVYPICTECNSRLGRFIRDLGSPPGVQLAQSVRSRSVDSEALLGATLDHYRAQFYEAFNSRDLDAARKAAAKAIAISKRHVGESGPQFELADGEVPLPKVAVARVGEPRVLQDPSGRVKPPRAE